MLLGATDYDLRKEEQLIEAMLRRRPEAIVVTGGRHTERAQRHLAASIPVVEMWDLSDAPLEHVVGCSNAAAAGAMVEHLHGRRDRTIAYMGGSTDRDTAARTAAGATSEPFATSRCRRV